MVPMEMKIDDTCKIQLQTLEKSQVLRSKEIQHRSTGSCREKQIRCGPSIRTCWIKGCDSVSSFTFLSPKEVPDLYFVRDIAVECVPRTFMVEVSGWNVAGPAPIYGLGFERSSSSSINGRTMAYWMDPLSPHVDVAEFNALPRNPHLPTSAANNHWHFDIRFIPFETNPSHVLFLVQPESGYFITEFLPLGVPPGGDHHAWFPETSVDAAPPVAKAILQCFLTGYSARPKRAEALGLSHSIQTFAPWSLSTCSGNLATAMEKEFKRLGVSEDRCTVEVSDIQTKGSTIDEAFSRWMQEFKWVLGISRVASGLLPDPRAISFDYKIQSIQDAFKVSPDDQGTKMACGQQLWNCRPATREKIFYATEEPMYGMFHQDMQAVDLFDRIPTKLVAAEADKEGLPETMMNYGLR